MGKNILSTIPFNLTFYILLYNDFQTLAICKTTKNTDLHTYIPGMTGQIMWKIHKFCIRKVKSRDENGIEQI